MRRLYRSETELGVEVQWLVLVEREEAGEGVVIQEAKAACGGER